MFFKLFCVVLCLNLSSGFLNPRGFKGNYGNKEGVKNTGLKLTPYIQAGQLEEAKQLSSVEPLLGNVTSYSAFLTVDEECDSNLFFWFYPAEENYEEAPVILWLEGGPGVPVAYAILLYNGPYLLTPDMELTLNEYPWTKFASMLYIDNPVETGYSYTNTSKDGCLCRNQIQVADGLYEAMTQFFKLFTELQDNPFYLAGESYAGKYIPSLGTTIHINNKNSSLQKINLAGLAIGNGLIDPYTQSVYGDLAYYIGIIDSDQRAVFNKREEHIKYLINGSEYLAALTIAGDLMIGPDPYFKKVTGFGDIYNFLSSGPMILQDINVFMDGEVARNVLHVGDSLWNSGEVAYEGLAEDIMKSVKPWFEELLDNKYRTLVYTGQTDLLVNYQGTSELLLKLNFSAANEFKNAPRNIWRIGEEVAGYVKKGGSLTDVLVRNAGHMVVAYQPAYAYDMITKFINDQLP